jgi:hypothetical protein
MDQVRAGHHNHIVYSHLMGTCCTITIIVLLATTSLWMRATFHASFQTTSFSPQTLKLLHAYQTATLRNVLQH